MFYSGHRILLCSQRPMLLVVLVLVKLFSTTNIVK